MSPLKRPGANVQSGGAVVSRAKNELDAEKLKAVIARCYSIHGNGFIKYDESKNVTNAKCDHKAILLPQNVDCLKEARVLDNRLRFKRSDIVNILNLFLQYGSHKIKQERASDWIETMSRIMMSLTSIVGDELRRTFQKKWLKYFMHATVWDDQCADGPQPEKPP